MISSWLLGQNMQLVSNFRYIVVHKNYEPLGFMEFISENMVINGDSLKKVQQIEVNYWYSYTTGSIRLFV